jgi:hypothetical protein
MTAPKAVTGSDLVMERDLVMVRDARVAAERAQPDAEASDHEPERHQRDAGAIHASSVRSFACSNLESTTPPT